MYKFLTILDQNLVEIVSGREGLIKSENSPPIVDDLEN